MTFIPQNMLSLGIAAGSGFVVGWLSGIMTRPSKAVKSGNSFQQKIKLYHCHTYASSRCLWLMEELGKCDEMDIVEYDPYTTNKTKATWYKNHIHPKGLVPALQLGVDNIMLESAAICMYLADFYGEMLPTANERHNYYMWMAYTTTTLDPAMKILWYAKNDTETADLDKARETCHGYLKCMETHLCENELYMDGRDYLCGYQMTAADIVAGYSLHWIYFYKKGDLLDKYTRVREYYNRLRERPTFAQCLGTDDEWTSLWRGRGLSVLK